MGPWLKRVGKWIAFTLAGVLALLTLLLLGVGVALQTSAAQQRIATLISEQASKALKGRVEVSLDGSLSFWGFSQITARLLPEDETDARPLIELQDVDASWDLLALLGSLVSSGPLTVGINHVRVGHSLVDLRSEANGNLALAEAIALEESTPTEPETETPSPFIHLQKLEINDTRVLLPPQFAPPAQPSSSNDERTSETVRPIATIALIDVALDMQDVLSANVRLSSIETPVPGLPSVLFADLGASAFLDEQSAPTLKVVLDGNLQGLPVSLDGIYDANEWFARLDANGSASEWQGAGLGLEPTEALSVSARAEGNLEAATVHAKVGAAQAVAEVAGNVGFSPFRAEGLLAVTSVDPRSIHVSAPTGNLNAMATFTASGETQATQIKLAVRDSAIQDNPVPDFDLLANGVGSSRGTFSLKALDGSKLELSGSLDNQQDAVSFELEGKAERLPESEAAPQLKAVDVRALNLEANGTWRPKAQTLEAALKLSVARARVPAAQLSIADLSAHLTADGSLRSPALQGNVTARALRVGQISATRLGVGVQAQTLGVSTVEAKAQVRLSDNAPTRDISLATTLTSLSPLEATNTVLSVASNKRTLTTVVREFELGDRIRATGIRVSGVGDATGELTVLRNNLDLEAQVVSLDLAAVSEVFNPFLPELEGTVVANVALKTKGDAFESGHLFARASDVGTKANHADHLGASLVLEHDELSGTVTVVRGQSRARLDTRDVALSLLRKETPRVRDFRGYVVASINVDSRDFPDVDQLIGDIHAEGRVQSQLIVQQRDDLPLQLESFIRLSDVTVRKVEPRIPVDGATKREIAAKKAVNPELKKAAEQWALPGVSAVWFGSYEGSNGRVATSVDVHNTNHPPLARVTLDTTVSLDRLEDIATLLPQLPIKGSLVIPETNLDSLPTGSFVPKGLAASVAANVDFEGKVNDPQVKGTLHIIDARVVSTGNAFPVSLAVEATASKAGVNADFKLTHEALEFVTGNVKGTPSADDWRGTARIEKLPLDRIPYVRDYGITGDLTGKVEFESGSSRPSLVATFDAKDVEAYGERMRSVSIAARLSDGNARLETRIQQTSGHARLEASAVSGTGELSDYRPTNVRLEAQDFQIRPLLVAMRESVSDLSGVLDGVVQVAFEDGSTHATGELRLKDGVVLVPALGKQVHDIEVVLRAAPGKLELSRLDAKVERGRLQGKGKLAYDSKGGLAGEVNLVLPEDAPLPIANKGRDIASAAGRIKLQASLNPSRPTSITVDVPKLDVYFSDSVTDEVGETASPTFVTFGTYLPDGHFVSYKNASQDKLEGKDGDSGSDKAPQPLVVKVALGKDVWLHHGTSTFAGIRGNVELAISETTSLTGRLDLAEGRIDIQGRVFDIRPGTVTFQGLTPPNPDVVAEAAWTAPSGYTVIASYRGSVSNGKVVLRSEPALSYGEILNVLLFDDPEGAGSSEGAPGAGEVAATVASAGLSQSLTSLTDLDIQASIDSDPTGSPRPELGVRISPRLAVEVAYVVAPSAALSQPPDKAFVSFDWRLSNAWSVEATLGDHGSAATDVTWKYRY